MTITFNIKELISKYNNKLDDIKKDERKLKKEKNKIKEKIELLKNIKHNKTLEMELDIRKSIEKKYLNKSCEIWTSNEDRIYIE